MNLGCAGLVWSVLWFFVSSGSPSTHRYINHEEKVYITENVGKVATANMTVSFGDQIHRHFDKRLANHRPLEYDSLLAASLGYNYLQFLPIVDLLPTTRQSTHLHERRAEHRHQKCTLTKNDLSKRFQLRHLVGLYLHATATSHDDRRPCLGSVG